MATIPELYALLKNSYNEYGSSEEDISSFKTALQEEKDKLEETIKRIQTDFAENFQPSFDEIGEQYDDISYKLNKKRAITEKALGIVAKLSEDSRPMFAVSAYEKCQRLKDDIDMLDSSMLTRLPNKAGDSFTSEYHGFRNFEKLNVFLVGEFSSGKTTFTRRLIEDLSGSVSGAPETACVVIHRCGDAKSISITFKDAIQFATSEKEEAFEKFLRDYDLRKKFKIENGQWDHLDNEKIFTEDRWATEKILDFIKRSNAFPEAFECMTWTHVKAGRNKNLSTFLDFANIYDMPGIAGEISHNMVIQEIFSRVQPDIILYLIDTARGNPSEDEAITIKTLVEGLAAKQHKSMPDFYWVYQKPSEYTDNIEDVNVQDFVENKDDEWVDNHVTLLKDFIQLLMNGNEKVAAISEDASKYLTCSNILDARGPQNDYERAQNAVATTLVRYYINNGKKFTREVSEKIMITPKLPQILKLQQDYFYQKQQSQTGENPVLQSVIQKIKNMNNCTPENFREELRSALGLLDFAASCKENNIFPPDLLRVMNMWCKKISDTIGIIVNASCIPPKEKKFFANMFSYDKYEPKELDLNFISKSFWTKFNSEPTWQEMVYLAQALSWLRESYSGNLTFYNISEIGNELTQNLKKEIKSLEVFAELKQFIHPIPFDD